MTEEKKTFSETQTFLIVTREEAVRKIKDQIEKGKEIRESIQSWYSAEELEKASAKETSWFEYNVELLKSLFSNDSIASQYRAIPLAVLATRPNPFECLNICINIEVTQLESILERLELYQEIETRKATSHIIEKLSNNKQNIFIVHGHDEAAKESVARFFEVIDLSYIILHEMPDRGRTIIEKFEDYSNVAFAVVLLTPDDICESKEKPGQKEGLARQNVIFELGFFIGKLGRGNVCALYKEDTKIPSDYTGVLYTPFDSSGGWKLKLAQEIKSAGIDVDLNKAIKTG